MSPPMCFRGFYESPLPAWPTRRLRNRNVRRREGQNEAQTAAVLASANGAALQSLSMPSWRRNPSRASVATTLVGAAYDVLARSALAHGLVPRRSPFMNSNDSLTPGSVRTVATNLVPVPGSHPVPPEIGRPLEESDRPRSVYQADLSERAA